MGYMGFGMQRWIYTQKPKKVFSKEKKLYGDDLSRLPHVETVQDEKLISESDRKTLLREVKNFRERESAQRILTLISALIVALLVMYFLSQIVKDYLLSL